MKRVLITGITGLIGRAVSQALRHQGIKVLGTARHPQPKGTGIFQWNALTDPFDPRWLEGVDGVIHLAGVPIVGLWTPSRKRQIRESRVEGTRKIVHAIQEAGTPQVLIGASAVGFYGHRGEEDLDESSPPGTGFLADVVKAWEEATLQAPTRTVVMRLGIVFSTEGGAFRRFVKLGRWGMGVGWRNHWMSWIVQEDVIRAMVYAFNIPSLEGPVNVTAPTPLLWCEFWRKVASGRPTWCLPRPIWLPEQIRELTSSQRVFPRKLLAEGFSWKFSTFEAWWNAIASPSTPGKT